MEREREKLAKKAESVKKSVLQQIPNNWMTREGHTLKTALEQTITSIIESEDDNMTVNKESGINTLNTLDTLSSTGTTHFRQNLQLEHQEH